MTVGFIAHTHGAALSLTSLAAVTRRGSWGAAQIRRQEVAFCHTLASGWQAGVWRCPDGGMCSREASSCPRSALSSHVPGCTKGLQPLVRDNPCVLSAAGLPFLLVPWLVLRPLLVITYQVLSSWEAFPEALKLIRPCRQAGEEQGIVPCLQEQGTVPTLAPRCFGQGSGAGCGAAGSRSLAQPLVYPTLTQVSSLSLTLFGCVRLEILTGTREIKPRCLQTHHSHTVGSPSLLAEEEEEEREVMPLCRTLSLSQQPTRGRVTGTQHTGQMG